MNPLAQELNDILNGSLAAELLSDFGKRMYFPKGIISQTAEANQHASTYNATIGIAATNGLAMGIESIHTEFNNNLSYDDVFPYAPTAGEPKLRKIWQQQMQLKNPALQGKKTSLPVVTAGLTHAINIAAALFVNKGDVVLIPDLYWGNYDLVFTEQLQAKQVHYPLFDHNRLNIKAMEQAIDSVQSDKLFVMLNFPNNPTGYTPTTNEAHALVQMLIKKADEGKKLVVFTDDAYWGLFFEQESYTQSLFALLADAHKNILAIKGDAATKEEMVWGFRVAFITFNSLGMNDEHYEALIKKTMGIIRGGISSCSKPAQTILLKGMKSAVYAEQKRKAIEEIGKRYTKMKEVLTAFESNSLLKPLPFNSGYFMSFICAGDAEKLRLHLLHTYGIGTISIKRMYLRITFSSIDVLQMTDLVTTIFKAAQEVFA
ncbi:MAG: aminotransferase class I/II-fold pyridoxal phosphate-dependent enzyme [Sphaerochaetaceae bacterium]|jgi:aspartate/methionine/tyrosine aminotransferase